MTSESYRLMAIEQMHVSRGGRWRTVRLRGDVVRCENALTVVENIRAIDCSTEQLIELTDDELRRAKGLLAASEMETANG